MKVKDIVEIDTVNANFPAMFIATYICSFKCDKECGSPVCQNSPLAHEPVIEIDNDEIIQRFFDNPVTEGIVIGGLEPFDDFDDLWDFLCDLERATFLNQGDTPKVVIYTGYTKKEINNQLWMLNTIELPFIIKYGRFIPNQNPHYDEVLGVNLASDNQYAQYLEDTLNELTDEYISRMEDQINESYR